MRITTLAFLLLTFATSIVSADDNTLKIGVSVPLSGALANVGEDIRRGFELGIEETKNSPVKLVAVYDDNGHAARLGASSAHKLLERDKVDVIVSLWDVADTVAPIAETKKIPHIAIRWNPHITENRSFTFTMESTYKSWINSELALLRSLNVKRIAIITEQSPGWVLGLEWMNAQAPQYGIEVVASEFLSTDLDYRSPLLRMSTKKPDRLVINANPPHIDLIIQRAQEVMPKVPFSGYLDLTQDLSLIEGVPYVAQFKTAEWFEKKFQARYGEPFQARAPHAYDIVMILNSLVTKLGRKPRADEIVAHLASLKDGPGATGNITTSATRNIESECVWKLIKEGKPVFLPMPQAEK